VNTFPRIRGSRYPSLGTLNLFVRGKSRNRDGIEFLDEFFLGHLGCEEFLNAALRIGNLAIQEFTVQQVQGLGDIGPGRPFALARDLP
jgi:hypothetical protein